MPRMNNSFLENSHWAVIRWGSETSWCMQTSRFPWHWFQTNWTVAIFSTLFQWDKIWTACKRKFEQTVPKLSVNSGNPNSQDSHKKLYPDPVLNFGLTDPQYSDKCWSYWRLECYIFTIAKTHTEDEHNYPIHALVSLFRTNFPVLVSKHD